MSAPWDRPPRPTVFLTIGGPVTRAAAGGRSDPARHRDAGHRRHRGLRAYPQRPALFRRAHHHGDVARRHGQPGQRVRGRRYRLHHQAAQPHRACWHAFARRSSSSPNSTGARRASGSCLQFMSTSGSRRASHWIDEATGLFTGEVAEAYLATAPISARTATPPSSRSRSIGSTPIVRRRAMRWRRPS